MTTRAGRAQKSVEALERFRIAWAWKLAGLSDLAIAQKLDVSRSAAVRILNEADAWLGYVRAEEFNVTELRRLESERLDALQAAHWGMATGDGIREFLVNLASEGFDDDTAAYIERQIPAMVAQSQAAAALILKIMERRSRLLRIDDAPDDESGLMPVLVFTAPRPYADTPREEAIEATSRPALGAG